MIQEDLKNLDSSQREELARVAAANLDLRERIEAEGLEIDYRVDRDYLYIVIGGPKDSIAVSLNELFTAVAIVDPDTYRLNGIEVPFFKEMLAKYEPRLALWGVVISILDRQHGSAVCMPSRKERESTQRALEALLVA